MPIFTLTILSNGLEKIIHSRLTSFLNKREVLPVPQFGFHKTKPTEIALMKQKDLIITALEEKSSQWEY